ncbi:MAG: methylmalonyl-CoA epimerase [Gemmatimonadota bacterium]
MFSYPLDHVAVAVTSLEEACPLFQLVAGESCSPVEELPAQGVRVLFAGSIELIEPLGPVTPVGRFLQRRGPGLHHIAYRVPDLPEALSRLKEEGLELIDETPRLGSRGHHVAFLHPRSTGGFLIELVEARSLPCP